MPVLRMTRVSQCCFPLKDARTGHSSFSTGMVHLATTCFTARAVSVSYNCLTRNWVHRISSTKSSVDAWFRNSNLCCKRVFRFFPFPASFLFSFSTPSTQSNFSFVFLPPDYNLNFFFFPSQNDNELVTFMRRVSKRSVLMKWLVACYASTTYRPNDFSVAWCSLWTLQSWCSLTVLGAALVLITARRTIDVVVHP